MFLEFYGRGGFETLSYHRKKLEIKITCVGTMPALSAENQLSRKNTFQTSLALKL